MKRYEIPISDWTKVDLNNADFILKEAKDYVSYLSSESDRITDRSFSMIRILLPTVIVLIGLFVKSTFKSSFFFIEICIGLSIIVSIYLIYQFYRLTFPRDYMPIGRSPKELESDSFYGVDSNFSVEESRIILRLNEIENCTKKIDFNENQNLFRSTKLKFNMQITWRAIISFSVIIISGLLISQLS